MAGRARYLREEIATLIRYGSPETACLPEPIPHSQLSLVVAKF